MADKPRYSISSRGTKTRQRILDAAKRLMLEGGPEAVMLRDVAARLGMTHGNLQYYYPVRHLLLVAIFDQETARYTDGITEAVSAETTRRGRMDALIESGLVLLRSPEIALWRLMVGMLDHNEEMAALHKKEIALYERAVAEQLRSIAPELTPKKRRHLAKIIQAVIDGMSIQRVHDDPNSAELRALEKEIKDSMFKLVDASP